MNIEEHIRANAKYGNETTDTALVQVYRDGRWQDYGRTEVDSALRFVEGQHRIGKGPMRVVDWITREEVTR